MALKYSLVLFVFVLISVYCVNGAVVENRNRPAGETKNDGQPAPVAQDPDAGGNRAFVPNQVHDRPQVPAAQAVARPSLKIAENPACADDVKRLCAANTLTNNFAVLGCLQYDRKDDADLSPDCEHFIWNYKKNLTTDFRFESAANELCGDVLKAYPECQNEEKGKGRVIPCLIENMENVSNVMCREYLKKMARIVFSDYRLIYKFADSCAEDINAFKCGRLHEEEDVNKPHLQGRTVECLAEHLRELKNDECRTQILRVAELQSDDFNLDRPLYYACRDDREHFCPRVKAGGGRVFKCLFRHKFDREMSTACRDKLTARQKLMQEDFKVNRPLFDACREDVRKYKCMKGDNVPEERFGRLSRILICLEGVIRQDQPVAPECVTEMRDMRRSLLEDYQITPDLVNACTKEISGSCGGGLQREGKTLHCLMDLARKTEKQDDGGDTISDRCRRQLESLLEEADAGEDYEMDPVLHDACAPVAQQLCKDMKPGDGRVINCLTDKLDSDKMTDECEERLLEIQFFIQRDIKLDVQLFHYCQLDAKEKCGFEEPKPNVPSAQQAGPAVFSCLYRHLKFAKEASEKLRPQCVTVLHHKLRQRAAAIDMEPQIQEKCLADLSQWCPEKHGKGEEMQCLQEHLEDLSDDCHEVIGNFTEDETEDLEMDKVLMKACSPMIKKFCGDLLENDETEAADVMQCLIENKKHHDMDPKCRAGVEHKQIISLQDFRFTLKFKQACKEDVLKHCRDSRKKMEVLECLSGIQRDDILQNKAPRLSGMCRQQMRFELLQREENIDLDPQIKKPCEVDLRQFCTNVVPGASAKLECLKKHQKSLSETCHKAVFNREKEEAEDPNVDYLLVSNCKGMIKRYCADSPNEELFNCLKHNKDKPEFDGRCRAVVFERLRQKAQDYRLDVELVKKCHQDIPKFCGEELRVAKEGGKDAIELEGKIVGCLRIRFAQKKLSPSCETYMTDVIKESALDYQQDVGLKTKCEVEIKTYCLQQVVGDSEATDDQGRVKDCLKERLMEGKITRHECIAEIARVLAESRADVQVDPILHKACAIDIKHYCFDVPPGEGRQMSCLLAALEKKVKLQSSCHNMPSQRVELWNLAAKDAPPETLGEVYDAVLSSPSRNYFLTVFMCVMLVIFVGGLCCGRVTKRVRREMKTK